MREEKERAAKALLNNIGVQSGETVRIGLLSLWCDTAIIFVLRLFYIALPFKVILVAKSSGAPVAELEIPKLKLSSAWKRAVSDSNFWSNIYTGEAQDYDINTFGATEDLVSFQVQHMRQQRKAIIYKRLRICAIACTLLFSNF